jgi:hypothetical protein
MTQIVSKTCPSCDHYAEGKKRVEEDFGFSKDKPNTYCKNCKRKKDKEYRANKKAKDKESMGSRIEKERALAKEVKAEMDAKQNALEAIRKKMEEAPEPVIYEPTKDMNPDAICKFTREILEDMLIHLERSGAMQIGVGLRKQQED